MTAVKLWLSKPVFGGSIIDEHVWTVPGHAVELSLGPSRAR